MAEVVFAEAVEVGDEAVQLGAEAGALGFGDEGQVGAAGLGAYGRQTTDDGRWECSLQ
ncbi:MAG: hypothetical protein L0322_19660 [Chloroflexi bacterium]|nr:hypothetical protein [Chloroflexota bacterium]